MVRRVSETWTFDLVKGGGDSPHTGIAERAPDVPGDPRAAVMNRGLPPELRWIRSASPSGQIDPARVASDIRPTSALQVVREGSRGQSVHQPVLVQVSAV